MERCHTKANASQSERDSSSPRAGWKRIVKKFGLFKVLSLILTLIIAVSSLIIYGNATLNSLESNESFITLAKETLETDSQDSDTLKNNLSVVLSSTFVGYEEVPHVKALLYEIENTSFSLSKKQYDEVVPLIIDYLEKTSDLKTGTYAFKALNSVARAPLALTPMGSVDLTLKVYNSYGNEFADFISKSTNKIAASLHAKNMHESILSGFY